jgi:hypothetical protein
VEYYGQLLKVPFWFSLKYFLVYFLFYSLLATGVVTARYLLPLNEFFTMVLPSELAEIYPAELEIKLKDGSVRTNVKEPYEIPFTRLDILREEFNKRILGVNTTRLINILVIDTEAKIEDFSQYQSLSLLTEHHLSYLNEDGSIVSVPLIEVGDLVLNKIKLEEWMGILMPYLSYVVPFLVGFIFLGLWGGVTLSRGVFSLMTGVILWWLTKLMGKNLSFMKSWQLNLHFVVISTTGFSLLYLLGRGLEVPFLETLLVVVLGVMVVNKVKGEN